MRLALFACVFISIRLTVTIVGIHVLPNQPINLQCRPPSVPPLCPASPWPALGLVFDLAGPQHSVEEWLALLPLQKPLVCTTQLVVLPLHCIVPSCSAPLKQLC